MSKSKPSKAESLNVIGAVQYSLEDIDNKSIAVANWLHNHYSHMETDSETEKKIIKKTRAKGYYEIGDRIYVLSQFKK